MVMKHEENYNIMKYFRKVSLYIVLILSIGMVSCRMVRSDEGSSESRIESHVESATVVETTTTTRMTSTEMESETINFFQKTLLVDNADLLTKEEEEELMLNLEEIRERQQFDVVVVTVKSLEEKTLQEYADDFYDYNGYGYGENADGVLLLVSMEDRDWHVTTTGYGITAMTDAGLDYMSEKFVPYLSNGDYMGSFTVFAELCDDFLTQAKTGNPYDVDNLPK